MELFSNRPAKLTREQPPRFADDHVGIAWLDEHVIGARASRAIRIVAIAVACNREYRNGPGPRVGPKAPAQLDAVHSGNRNVSEDEVWRDLERFGERLMAVVRLIDGEPVAGKSVGIKLTRFWIVLDDQHERQA